MKLEYLKPDFELEQIGADSAPICTSFETGTESFDTLTEDPHLNDWV